jgi:mono/diheme cytochrome c family protein
MNMRFSKSSLSATTIVAAIAAVIAQTSTAVAAAPTQGEGGVIDNFLIVVIGSTLLALLAALGGGAIIAFLAVGVSRFFRRNLPTDEEMADLRAITARSEGGGGARKPIRIGPTAEPFVIAGVGFVALFAISSAVLAAQPRIVQGNEETERPAVVGLPKEGDLTQIVSELPPGDAASGSKLYVSSGCSGCHSLEKDKRLVGPSFYNVWDVAKTRVPDLGPKEYLYESIVNPNKYIVDGYQANIMNQTFSTQLNPQQMADILAWLERDHANQQ